MVSGVSGDVCDVGGSVGDVRGNDSSFSSGVSTSSRSATDVSCVSSGV